MATTTLQFRLATQDDAPHIQHLVQEAFRSEDSRQEWTSDMELSRRFRMELNHVIATITKPDSVIIMATDTNNVLVGSIEVTKRPIGDGRLSMLAVDQHQQRGGLGRQILDYAEAYAQRTWAVKKFALNALSTRQELISWYIRRGYHKTGETSPFPRQLFADLDLAEDLCFVELEKDVDADPAAAETA